LHVGVLIRVWRTGVKSERIAEYEEFERNDSLAMFKQQAGCLGVLFLRSREGCAALSLWRAESDIAALESSPTYQETVARLMASGLLEGEQRIEIFHYAGGAADSGLFDLIGTWPGASPL
jgi:heme-degrading monooxygenase HmoA